MESEQAATAASTTRLSPFKYSNRVLLKTILERRDGGLELIGERVVIGGWVKSSKEVRKEPVPHIAGDYVSGEPEPRSDVSCIEILQSRIPFLRTIVNVLGGGSGDHYPHTDKLETSIHKSPPPSTVFLKVGDGSCVASLQVVIESSLAPPCQLLHTGTCIIVEGLLQKSLVLQGKYVIELKVDKVHHIGTVEYSKYPLSKKRVPLDKLREFCHIRPRTTTVQSVMRIRNALEFAAHTFCQNHGFLSVHVPIITTTDGKGSSEKFLVTSHFAAAGEKEPPMKAVVEIDGVSIDVIKAAVKEKSNLLEELKRSDSNKEAVAAATQDLKKANELASQLEAREKSKPKTSQKVDNVKSSEGYFSSPTYLTSSGRMHLESYACAFGNVYSFGPRFQAGKGESPKHTAETWMIEVELAFSELEEAINCAGDFFKSLCKWVVENCSEDMKFLSERIDKTRTERLQSMVLSTFERVSYTEALDALKKVTEKTKDTKIEWGAALTEADLSYLADEIYKKPVIVYNYPKETKPFYVRLNNDGKTVAAFDMVVPKAGRLISGSQNEERINILTTRIKELGLAAQQYEWYLDLRRHGTVKHSGFNLEFDHMVLFATGLNDVRDVIPFPRSRGKANY
ncbi:asparagine--tRNA ligase, cytoplasmic 2-like [Pyrus communis]|uniref:asparagine--tRNA ligase, cytoplasmic 2-like n=1 Tax=Pyrus communis TaxID=23211 RepID=UPI0035BFB386